MNTTYSIRLLQAKDFAELLQVEQAAHPLPWTENVLQDCLTAGYPSWVVECQNKIIGYAMIQLVAQECSILNICVVPELRRQGIARRLLQYVIDQAIQLQAQIIFLEVRASNHAARALYEQLGFNEMSIRKQYYPTVDGTREDAIMLGLQLDFSFIEATKTL